MAKELLETFGAHSLFTIDSPQIVNILIAVEGGCVGHVHNAILGHATVVVAKLVLTGPTKLAIERCYRRLLQQSTCILELLGSRVLSKPNAAAKPPQGILEYLST